MNIDALTLAARAAGFAMAASEELLEPQVHAPKADEPIPGRVEETSSSDTMLIHRVQPASAGWWSFWKLPA
jgi:hypothetical protein